MAAPQGVVGARRAPTQELKVVLVGDIGVGKTSTVARFTKDTFNELMDATIGASYMAKEITHKESGTRLKFSIWDTAGQEQYHSLVPMYFRQAAAVILIFNITQRDSFTGAQKWVQQIRENAADDIIILMAGNKCDLENERKVTDEEAQAYSASISASYHKTSAKTAEGINELFEDIANRFLQGKKEGGDSSPTVPDDRVKIAPTKAHNQQQAAKPKPKKKCC